jgi:type II secretory pathway predicted ATPase ExeA
VSAAPWAAHFGLARTPFGESIAARDLFPRQAHAEAIARISFCIVENALGVVTGDVGAGKTVALRAAVAALDPTRHQVVYISNPSFGTRGLYVSIVRALGAQPRYLKAELMAQASDLLAAEAAERHRRVVVICDLCRAGNYADCRVWRCQNALWRRASRAGSGPCGRHSYRLSRKARTESAGL